MLLFQKFMEFLSARYSNTVDGDVIAGRATHAITGRHSLTAHHHIDLLPSVCPHTKSRNCHKISNHNLTHTRTISGRQTNRHTHTWDDIPCMHVFTAHDDDTDGYNYIGKQMIWGRNFATHKHAHTQILTDTQSRRNMDILADCWPVCRSSDEGFQEKKDFN